VQKIPARSIVATVVIVLSLILFCIDLLAVSYVPYERVVYIVTIVYKDFKIEISYYTLSGKLMKFAIDSRILTSVTLALLTSLLSIELKKRRRILLLFPLLSIVLLVPSLILPVSNFVQQLAIIVMMFLYEYYLLRENNKTLLDTVYSIVTLLTLVTSIAVGVEYVLALAGYLWLAAVLATLNDLSVATAFIFLLLSIPRVIYSRKETSYREKYELPKKVRWTLILFGILLSIILSVLPFTPALNPKNVPISVDTYYYYMWLKMIQKHGLAYAYVADLGLRPLYLTLLYILHLAGIPIWAIAMYHIIPLLVLFTITIYFFTKTIYHNDTIASLSVLLCPLSVSFMTFLYGGFHANLFSLSLLMISIVLLFKSSSMRSIRFILSCIISVLVLLIHPWVWVQIMTGLLAYVLYIRFRLRNIYENRFRIMRNFLIINMSCCLIRFLYHVKAIRSVAMPVIGVMVSRPVVSIPSQIWYQFNILVWGSASIVFYYLGCISALLYLIGRREPVNYLDTLLLVSIFPFFAQPLRIIINTFPNIFLALFLYSIYEVLDRKISKIIIGIMISVLLIYGFYWTIMSVPHYKTIPWNIPKR